MESLFNDYKKGKQAEKELLESYKYLIFKVTEKFCGSYRDPFNEEKQKEFKKTYEAAERGLLLAVEKFDFTKGYRFQPYAIWWMKHSVYKMRSENSKMIRLLKNNHL